MPLSRSEARELMSRGYEAGISVINGTLQRRKDGGWMIDNVPLERWLDQMDGEQVVILASAVQSGRGQMRTCTVCGSEYTGHECPRCRQARRRLRGR